MTTPWNPKSFHHEPAVNASLNIAHALHCIADAIGATREALLDDGDHANGTPSIARSLDRIADGLGDVACVADALERLVDKDPA